jgi:hypothetical protein
MKGNELFPKIQHSDCSQELACPITNGKREKLVPVPGTSGTLRKLKGEKIVPVLMFQRSRVKFGY